ncbi:hypothetical protein METBIDRAFT_12644 [Metschnikowia bicuspidata var. bicuspidata NRRL YB-4993]|uniref:Uncharacterized protein n=1 Tax=Metschnikowia bicuspidata var. bicuspidata NRRL YB-4993 TaxID=869754 RepID=A0A1A0H9L9_9ASCO|nr:hypothetical protein METBIDRAFT_12644 [Metschnikowia bicuspidata var. bicuspidata NRRL YB-4993]OBA20685.1 hypothetical protein METBIDRAFT_12644 [Metschnikowia bicuspidata var. bicuspidata NRRL YB-4993]
MNRHNSGPRTPAATTRHGSFLAGPKTPGSKDRIQARPATATGSRSTDSLSSSTPLRRPGLNRTPGSSPQLARNGHLRHGSVGAKSDADELGNESGHLRNGSGYLRNGSGHLRKDPVDWRKASAGLRKDSAEFGKGSGDLRHRSGDLRRNSGDLRKDTGDLRNRSADLETTADLRNVSADFAKGLGDLRKDTTDLRHGSGDLRKDTAGLRNASADLRNASANSKGSADLVKDTGTASSNGSHEYPRSGADPAASPATDNVLMQKRLVEQFYKMDAKITPPRAVFGGPLPDPRLADYPHDVPLRVSGNRGTAMPQTGSAASASAMALRPFDDGALAPTGCVDLLLNIDSRHVEYELGQASAMLAHGVASLEPTPRFAEPVPSGQQQLWELQQHLQGMQARVDEISAQLGKTVADAKTVYHEQTRRSMAKVAKLRGLLAGLAARVDAAKTKMASSRQLLDTHVADKIAVLELVSRRFEAYDLRVRQRRVRYLMVALALAALLLAAYMAVGGPEGG